jgi:hypothetical protein
LEARHIPHNSSSTLPLVAVDKSKFSGLWYNGITPSFTTVIFARTKAPPNIFQTFRLVSKEQSTDIDHPYDLLAKINSLYPPPASGLPITTLMHIHDPRYHAAITIRNERELNQRPFSELDTLTHLTIHLPVVFSGQKLAFQNNLKVLVIDKLFLQKLPVPEGVKSCESNAAAGFIRLLLNASSGLRKIVV